MVQRKAANKLGIQADQVKSNRLLVSLKPSSLQHQDTKNRGADMKKKLKKSRSMKCSDFECSSTPSLKRQVPLPGKPPPSVSPPGAASPQKKSPVKTSESTPSYMKSTSSSDARKEQSQVSCRNLLPLFDSKISSKKNSSSSEATSVSRPSSLMLVRTLTKTTSFKPARASANKCSPLALRENFNVQRATCSSTLKDSKFTAYLTLDSGGTEAEGTSAMKVCPYTYCSLNGHHHPPLPPLKSFLSARRRMLKTQRSIKLGCLSPRRSKPNKEAMEERQMGKVNFDDKSSSEEASNSSVIAPVKQEHDDFFIHIYSKEREIIADTSATSKYEEDDRLPFDASPNCHADSQVTESLLEESPLSEIACHDNSNENSGCMSRDMDTAEYSPEENQITKVVDEFNPQFLAAEESGLEGLSKKHDEEECTRSILVDDPEFGHSDMDWEEGRYSAFCLDDEDDNSLQNSQDYDLGGDSVEYDSFFIQGGSISKSDGIVNRSFEEIQAGKIHAKSFEEESVSSNTDFHQDFDIDEHVQGSGVRSDDQLELITMDEKNDAIQQSTSVETTVNIAMNPLGNRNEEPCADFEAKIKEDNGTAKVDPQVEVAPFSTIQTEIDAFTDYCENQLVQDDDAAEENWGLDSRDFHDMTPQGTTGDCKDATGNQNKVNPYQSDARNVINCINYQICSGNTPPQKKNSESETNCLKIDAGVAVKGKDQVGPFSANITIEVIITLRGSSEAAEMKSKKDPEANHLDAVAKDGKKNQTMADIDPPAGTEDHKSEEKFIAGGIENMNSLEENEAANFTSCESTDSGDQINSPTTEDPLAGSAEQNSQETEMDTTTSLGEEICATSKSTSDTCTGDNLTQDNSEETLGTTGKSLNWLSKRKTSTEEQEEPKDFNLRAPNFLPLDPEQEEEKVDLRHQMIDDRRNSEEWMLDYALQQAVTKLAPARKKKVALLVEAFEKVMPLPKCETQMMHASVGFAQSPQPIQACS